MVWAAEIVLLLSSGNHDINHLVPAVSLVRHTQLGYFLVAGGSVLGFLGGILCLTVPRRAMKVAQPTATPVPREKAAVPIADRVVTRGAAWGPAKGPSETSASVDSRTPAGVGSRR
jgi:hypothetical protein